MLAVTSSALSRHLGRQAEHSQELAGKTAGVARIMDVRHDDDELVTAQPGSRCRCFAVRLRCAPR